MLLLTIISGLPGSGKSFVRNRFGSNGFVHISTDDVIESIAKDRGQYYDDVWSEYIKQAETEVWDFARAAVADKRDIMWDQTNLTPKKRKRILSLVNRNFYTTHAVHVVCDHRVRAARLGSRRGKTVPRDVLESMERTMVLPTFEEGFDVVQTIDTTSGEPVCVTYHTDFSGVPRTA